MDNLDRQKIKRNIDKLIPRIDIDKIISPLLEQNIFNNLMIEDIKTEETNNKRTRKLLNDLCTRGPHAFGKFLNILRQTGHHKAFEILFETDENSLSALNINERQEEKMDSSETDSTKVIQDAQIIEKVIPATQWIQDSECYEISSKPRGLCLILNNYDFKNVKETRKGSERDVKMLNSVFEQLGYTVEVHTDKSAEDMMKIFEDFARRPEHYYLHSCIIIIMSHGTKELLYGIDCEEVYLKNIFKLFNNENCPALIGRPKLFFIQACRGEKYDPGVPLPAYYDVRSDGDLIPENKRSVTRGPTWTDMLITYSTIEGYEAFRDPNRGSWFMQMLIDVLMKRAWNTDLQVMLNDVNRKVITLESEYGEKQAVQIDSRGFRYKIFFNPGLENTTMI